MRIKAKNNANTHIRDRSPDNEQILTFSITQKGEERRKQAEEKQMHYINTHFAFASIFLSWFLRA